MVDSSHLALVIVLLGAGGIAGFIAGMFGIGGGVIIVPTLFYLLSFLGPEGGPHMKVAVATSLATIVFTSWRSVLAHHKRAAVDHAVLRAWAPWIAAGALSGVLIARWVDDGFLTLLFGIFGVLIAITTAAPKTVRALSLPPPRGALRSGLGVGVGFFSSWLGIGGGMFGVIILSATGMSMHAAVGTAAGFGVAIGLPGALGAMATGWGAEGLPPFSLGYVHVPAFFAIIVMTAITAPLGARAAHALSPSVLKRVFALGLAIIAARMALSGAHSVFGA